MSPDSFSALVPIAVAVVSALGSGSIVKAVLERKSTKATAEKTLAEGEVARSQEDREWVRQARADAEAAQTEAKARIDAAERRMSAAEKKAEIAEEHVRNLEHKVDELGDALRDLQLRLRHCPGGDICPLRP